MTSAEWRQLLMMDNDSVTHEQLLEAVKVDGRLLRYMCWQPADVVWAAVKRVPEAVEFIKSEKLRDAVKVILAEMELPPSS